MFSRLPFALGLLSTFAFLSGCSSSSGDDSGAGATGGNAGTSTGGTSTGGTSTGGASGGNASGTGGKPSGTGGASDGFPAIDLTADARMLTDAQKGELCDWVNAELGGYGLATTCAPGLSVSNDDNQAQCVSTRFNYRCAVTVQDVKDCATAQAPSHACDTDFTACHQLFCQ